VSAASRRADDQAGGDGVARRGRPRRRVAGIVGALVPRQARGRVGLGLIAVVGLAAVFAPVIAPYDPLRQDAATVLQSPSFAHVFGTDDFGRDILSRVIYGARTSVVVAVEAVALALVIGSSLGILAGFFRRVAGAVIMRAMDVLLAFPALILAITIVAYLGSGQGNVVIALALVYVPLFARVAEGAALAVRGLPYVAAARAIGDRPLTIVRRQVIPNAFPPILVQVTLALAYAMLAEAGLSFLGLGTQPPTPSWGKMLSDARLNLETAPWTVVFPGTALMLAVVGFNLYGDGIRDSLDPRLRDVV
jgi:peptide/nickel transport system permease protein